MDLLDVSSTIPLLPRLSSIVDLTKTMSPRRCHHLVVMIHCGPKTGSTMLHAACQSNLEETCGVEKQGRFPAGYVDEPVLFPLIRRCIHTTIMMPPAEVPTIRDDISLFVHMFPFREYDDWAKSAMKQQYDCGGSRACNRTSKLLEACKHN
jgi:hypothetical protein